jgi:hypothetical protein
MLKFEKTLLKAVRDSPNINTDPKIRKDESTWYTMKGVTVADERLKSKEIKGNDIFATRASLPFKLWL